MNTPNADFWKSALERPISEMAGNAEIVISSKINVFLTQTLFRFQSCRSGRWFQSHMPRPKLAFLAACAFALRKSLFVI